MGTAGDIGSTFDDFLEEEGLLETCEAVAEKKFLSYQVRALMEERGLSKSAMVANFNRRAGVSMTDGDSLIVPVLTFDDVNLALASRTPPETSLEIPEFDIIFDAHRRLLSGDVTR